MRIAGVQIPLAVCHSPQQIRKSGCADELEAMKETYERILGFLMRICPSN